MIRWDDASSPILLNPRLPESERARAEQLIAGCGPLDAHVWLTTSGTVGRIKPVALAKRALLASAEAVNTHLDSTNADTWLAALPAFHVGGLGIFARAHLAGAGVIPLDHWDLTTFLGLMTAHHVTLTALVPTQVRDLVSVQLEAPAGLRAVIVGGGALPAELWHAGRALGWPLLPSYGATETCSQVATASLSELDGDAPPPMRALPHVAIRQIDDGRLAMHGPSLLTGYASDEGLEDPLVDGWWVSEDFGENVAGVVTVSGRRDDAVKVGGELVALGPLQNLVDELRTTNERVFDAALIAIEDDRLGHQIVLAVMGDYDAADLLRRALEERVLPFERPRQLVLVRDIPRTELGKLKRTELKKVLLRRGSGGA